MTHNEAFEKFARIYPEIKKIHGYKKVCSESKYIPWGHHLEVFLDPDDMLIYTKTMSNNFWTELHDSSTQIIVCNLYSHEKAEEIKSRAVSAYLYSMASAKREAE